MATDVPFEIKGETRNVEEEDIARKVLQCRHSFDTETLLLCRKVEAVGNVVFTPYLVFGTECH